MSTPTPLYSLKKPTHWLWQTNLTREQVLGRLDQAKLTGDWLVCPLGEAQHAVTVDRFVSDPTVFDSSFPSAQNADEQSHRKATALEDDPFRILPCCFAGFNVLVFPMLASAGPIGSVMAVVTVGVICTEVGLLAVWSVFSPAHFVRRLVYSAAVGLLAYASLVVPLLAETRAELDAVFMTLVGLAHCPLLLFVVQMPMWAARIWLRFEVAKSDEAASGSYLRETEIRDLIVATAGIGVALAVIRMTRVAIGEHGGWGQYELDQSFQIFAYLVIGAAVASPVTITPLAFLTLGARRGATVGVGVGVWYLGIVALLTLVCRVAGISDSALLVCLFIAASFAAATCASLLSVRRVGYHLRVRGQA